MQHVDIEYLKGRSGSDHRSYAEAEPFPYVVIDDILRPATAGALCRDFPAVDDETWSRHVHDNARKHALADVDQMPRIFGDVFAELNSAEFCDYLSALTGLGDLLADDLLVGGGLHQTLAGGFLDVHADFNFHPVTSSHRRLNVIVYLNPDWAEEWNGNLELWDADMSHCVRSIIPVNNRAVVFGTTDTAFHGHPAPLACPTSRSRRSLATYYYTDSRPAEETSAPHSTLYQSMSGSND